MEYGRVGHTSNVEAVAANFSVSLNLAMRSIFISSPLEPASYLVTATAIKKRRTKSSAVKRKRNIVGSDDRWRMR